jgi:hypothetical protein
LSDLNYCVTVLIYCEVVITTGKRCKIIEYYLQYGKTRMHCCYTSILAVLIAITQYDARHVLRYFAMIVLAFTSVLFHFHLRFSKFCFKTKVFYYLDQIAIWPCGLITLYHGAPNYIALIALYIIVYFYLRSPLTIPQHCVHVHLPAMMALFLQNAYIKNQYRQLCK